MCIELISIIIGSGLATIAFLICIGILEILKVRKSQRQRKVILRRLELEPLATSVRLPLI